MLRSAPSFVNGRFTAKCGLRGITAPINTLPLGKRPWFRTGALGKERSDRVVSIDFNQARRPAADPFIHLLEEGYSQPATSIGRNTDLANGGLLAGGTRPNRIFLTRTPLRSWVIALPLPSLLMKDATGRR